MSPWVRANSTAPSASGQIEPMHAEMIPLQLLGRRQILVRRRQHREIRTTEEHQLPTRAQDPRRLGDPTVGIAPDRGAVLRDRQVEAPVTERRPLGVGVDQWEADPELVLEHPSGRELPRGVVEPDRAGAATREPGRDVARATAELDRVQSADLGEQTEARAPGRSRCPT